MIRKIGSVYGLFIGVISIFGAFLLEGGSFRTLFLLPALVIVFGGTFAATIIGFGFERFISIFKLIKTAYFPKHYDLKRFVNLFTDLSVKSRKKGILSIEGDIYKLNYHFPQKLIRYVIDGTDPVSLRELASLEIKTMQERHYSNIVIFSKMGGYAPTMGIIGTVMGLIMTLANAGSDPNLLIKNIATAFIATLWGVFSANIIWLPIGDKLKKCHSEEKMMMEISLEGVLALQNGEIPSIVKARLLSMLPQKVQQEMLNL
jgi:chemotaxis protein MotA